LGDDGPTGTGFEIAEKDWENNKEGSAACE
jgi:hypothetical protein